MAIPAQVVEAGELAEQLHAQMFNTEQEEYSNDEPEGAVDEPEVDEEEAKFEQRYKSLKGKYDSEVPRLSRELRELK